MKIKVQVMIEHEDETVETIVEEIGCLERSSASLESLGLGLAEGKEILANLQTKLVREQIDEYVRQFESCEHCGCKRRRNGRQAITYRTLFGKLRVSGQRFYQCGCQTHETRSFSPIADLVSERTAPEFRYLQTKWASLMSYGLTVELLEEVLPLSANVATVMRSTHQIAQKMEDELGDEQYMYIEGPSRNWAKLPPPDERLFVGIDGGFIRSREKNKSKGNWFEVIVGKSLLKHQSSKRFAFVQTYDEKPKRRLFETLRSHGMQMNQDVTFLSDGGDDVRELQYFLNPNAEHILDWFHVTMRITVMRQLAKGITDEQFQEKMLSSLDKVKWRLWHGHVSNALEDLDEMFLECEYQIEQGAKQDKLLKALDEFYTYIDNNRSFIPNYAERYRYDEIISTAFAESAVNEIVSKRMVKKQQMRWSKKGAHLLLQVRIKTLNNDLRKTFERWYPEMTADKSSTPHHLNGQDAAHFVSQHTV